MLFVHAGQAEVVTGMEHHVLRAHHAAALHLQIVPRQHRDAVAVKLAGYRRPVAEAVVIYRCLTGQKPAAGRFSILIEAFRSRAAVDTQVITRLYG